MHRPPDTIPTSGPQYQRMGSGGGGMSRAGLIVPPPPSMGANGSSGSRRHSVISSPKDNIGSHYLQLARNGAGGKRSSGGSEMRRPSEVWLCKSIPLLFLRGGQSRIGTMLEKKKTFFENLKIEVSLAWHKCLTTPDYNLTVDCH